MPVFDKESLEFVGEELESVSEMTPSALSGCSLDSLSVIDSSLPILILRFDRLTDRELFTMPCPTQVRSFWEHSLHICA